MPLLLRQRDTEGLLTIPDAIEAVEEGFRQYGLDAGLNAPRRRIHTRSGVRVSVHQGAVPTLGVTGLMTHCELVGMEAGTQRYLHMAPPVSVLFDADTAELKCLILGEIRAREVRSESIIALRTAATSAVGTRALARPSSTRLGLLGSGTQARHHLVAICSILPIESVKVYSRDAANRRNFCEELTGVVSAELTPVNRLEDAVEDVDVLVCCTNTNAPLFDGNLLQPGLHVTGIIGSNAGLVHIGALKERRRELDDTTIRRADVIAVNSREQVIQDQQADLYDPVQAGWLDWDRVAEIGWVLTGQAPGRTSDDQITLFKNNAGQGIADLAIAARAYDLARERGLGEEIAL